MVIFCKIKCDKLSRLPLHQKFISIMLLIDDLFIIDMVNQLDQVKHAYSAK